MSRPARYFARFFLRKRADGFAVSAAVFPRISAFTGAIADNIVYRFISLSRDGGASPSVPPDRRGDICNFRAGKMPYSRLSA